MPCESCAIQFSVFRRKRTCTECERYYCSGCLRRGGGICSPCRVLSTRPLSRQTIAHLKVRDLQCFLQRQNVSTRGCVEKEELVTLCVSHVNSTGYRRHGARNGSSPFSSLKGLTNNINDFINSAFDLRQSTQQPPDTGHSDCYNTAHAHAAAGPPGAAHAHAPRPERFTVTPGGERDIFVPVPEPSPANSGPDVEATAESPCVDTADCYEIEDLDDSGWEFVTRPADPLPNDSEVLLAENDSGHPAGGGASSGSLSPPAGARGPRGPRPGTPRRAASELELRRSLSAADTTDAAESADTVDTADTASLRDEPLMDDERSLGAAAAAGAGRRSPDEAEGEGVRSRRVSLSELQQPAQLEALSVRQLKELLARHRVGYRGCVERPELVARAALLLRDHRRAAECADLPLEECCKICMEAPLECVLLECGHMAACTACAKQLADCPICRQYVVRAVRVFRS